MSDTVSLGLDETLFSFPPGAPADAPPVMAGVPAVLVWGGAVLLGAAIAAGHAAISYLQLQTVDQALHVHDQELAELRLQVLALRAEKALTTGVGIEDLPPRYQAIANPNIGANTDISVSW
jgi:hypothetical protein